MTTTVMQVSTESARRTASAALRAAGLDVVEAGSWEEASKVLRGNQGTLVLLDERALQSAAPAGAGLPQEAARKLSHDLRTPLSAMAGWLHLLESGKLDQAGIKRAIEKLQANIDDQVRTIERCLGANTEEGRK